MDTIDKVCLAILHMTLAACVALLCVRLCTGCSLLEKASTKERIVSALRTAYEDGGKVAVSNKIEQLVVRGDLSSRQAERLHQALAGLYKHVIERLETELETDETANENAQDENAEEISI